MRFRQFSIKSYSSPPVSALPCRNGHQVDTMKGPFRSLGQHILDAKGTLRYQGKGPRYLLLQFGGPKISDAAIGTTIRVVSLS